MRSALPQSKGSRSAKSSSRYGTCASSVSNRYRPALDSYASISRWSREAGMLLLAAAFFSVCFRFRSDEAAADEVDLSEAETDESESELSEEEWRSESASLDSASFSRFLLRLLRSAAASSAAVLIWRPRWSHVAMNVSPAGVSARHPRRTMAFMHAARDTLRQMKMSDTNAK